VARSEVPHGWSGNDGAVARARLALHRWAMPGLVVLLIALFGFSASQGFPDRVEAVSTPILALLFGWASLRAWRGDVPSVAIERALLFVTLAVLIAAAIEPVLTGRFEIAYPYVLGYAPLGYAAAFLFLGPGGGWRAAGVTYLGLAGATVAGVATGQIPAVRMVPLILAHPILIGLLFSVAWSIAAAARDRAVALEQASVDALTGALNRRSGEQELERLRGGYGLLLVDLDAFKRLNDSRGHAFGDAVLKAVAEALMAHVRPDDLVVRWGGDEFLIVAPGAGKAVADALGQRVARAVRERSREVGVEVGASIGVAVRGREEAWGAVFERADRAMYRAKEGGFAVGSATEPAPESTPGP
jgi:diguanylate cyclase (GGDEF)-like protein